MYIYLIYLTFLIINMYVTISKSTLWCVFFGTFFLLILTSRIIKLERSLTTNRLDWCNRLRIRDILCFRTYFTIPVSIDKNKSTYVSILLENFPSSEWESEKNKSNRLYQLNLI